VAKDLFKKDSLSISKYLFKETARDLFKNLFKKVLKGTQRVLKEPLKGGHFKSCPLLSSWRMHRRYLLWVL
jgi:hypothetical protein